MKKFEIGDEVYVRGFEKCIFVINSIQTTLYYSYGTMSKSQVYEVRDRWTGQTYVAFADSLTLARRKDEVDKSNENKINKWLDTYNKYLEIHMQVKRLTGSEERCLQKANRVMRLMKLIS